MEWVSIFPWINLIYFNYHEKKYVHIICFQEQIISYKYFFFGMIEIEIIKKEEKTISLCSDNYTLDSQEWNKLVDYLKEPFIPKRKFSVLSHIVIKNVEPIE